MPPWEVGDFAERRTKHFVVLAPPTASVDDILASLESGYGTIRGVLAQGRVRRRYLVVVAGDAAQARALTTEIRGVETLAAISDAAITESGPERQTVDVLSLRLARSAAGVHGARPGRPRTADHPRADARRADGRHLGPHALMAGRGRRALRLRRPPPRAAGRRPRARSSAPGAIARASGDAQSSAYAVSSAAAFAIADRFGERRLLKLYDAFNDPKLIGAPGPRLVRRAVRRELGVSLAEIEAGL